MRFEELSSEELLRILMERHTSAMFVGYEQGGPPRFQVKGTVPEIGYIVEYAGHRYHQLFAMSIGEVEE